MLLKIINMKKNVFYVCLSAGLVLILILIMSVNSFDKGIAMFQQNVSALTRSESAGGWLWQKEWVKCTFSKQIIVSGDDAGAYAGVYDWSYGLEAELNSKNITYTIIDGGEGEKSYCRDGWNFCSKDDCR